MKDFYVDMGYIEASAYRRKVMEALSEGNISTPTKIAKITGIRVNHLSKTLSELKCRHIVQCLNEDACKGRLYQLTVKGQEILEDMEENNDK